MSNQNLSTEYAFFRKRIKLKCHTLDQLKALAENRCCKDYEVIAWIVENYMQMRGKDVTHDIGRREARE